MTATLSGTRRGGSAAVARPAGPTRADDLQVAGLSRLSTVDWPGRPAATPAETGCDGTFVFQLHVTVMNITAPPNDGSSERTAVR